MDKKNSRLSENQETLLDLWLAEKGEYFPPPDPIFIQKNNQAVPLTPAQYRIWFLEQITPGNPKFLISTAFRIRSAVSHLLLNRAIHYLWERHDSLRTTFFVMDDEVCQKDGELPPPELEWVDLRGLNRADQEISILETLEKESQTPFDLLRDCLCRFKLFYLPEDEIVFLITVHHIIADGWSVQLLFRELVQVYLSLLLAQEPTLPPLKISYFDFARWQETRIAGNEVQRQIEYWREKLQGTTFGTELPADFARPAVQTFTGAQQLMTLPQTLFNKLNTFSKNQGVTLFMTLLAVFKLLLYRHTGQPEMVIGTPVSGRLHPEQQGLVGLFVNSLVLRTMIQENQSFLDWLAHVRDTCLEAFAHQEVPIELLMRDLLASRDPARTPFFQIFFNMMDFDLPIPDLEVNASILSPPVINAHFDLTLYIERGQGQIHLTLVYNKLLFRPERMADLLQQYVLLLQQVVIAPEKTPAGYSLLTENARSILPDLHLDMSKAWPGPVFEHLDKWAREYPTRPAVSDPVAQWTYQELAANSNRIAHNLLAHDIGSGAVVAIYGWRSATLVAAIMGVLKSGAAVLMLDPRNPPARLQKIITAADPAGLITFTTADATSPFPEIVWPARPYRLAIPPDPEGIATNLSGFSAHPPLVPVQADHVAFLTFTSGSTGNPKGVICLHRSLTHFTPWMAEKFQFSFQDRFSMLSGIAHDPLQREIFTPLGVGAEIVIPDPGQMWQPGYLLHWIHEQRITIMHLIPAMIHALSSGEITGQKTHLRYVFFVGEPLTRHIAANTHALFNGVEIVNLYGAVETQRAVSYELVQQQGANPGQPKSIISLGRGIPDVQLLVLTKNLKPAGVGELGELYVRSPHLAGGYWQDDSETVRRFLPNPTGNDPLDRMFQTGDFGRYLPDGRVEFAGRRDRQINIRGFRIELSEVETAITALPEVASTVVVSMKQPDGETIIVAYIVPQGGGGRPVEKTLRQALKTRIPDYMMPAAFIVMPAIPLTPNGKVDFQALPPPTLPEYKEDAYLAPRDALEESLVTIWQNLLPQAKIGIHDDFFALGGHSILAIQMFSRLNKALHMELNVNLIYQYTTVADLAEIARRRQAERQKNPILFPQVDKNLICIQQGQPFEPTFFCVHGAGGDVLYMHGWRPYFEQWSLYGFEASGVDGLSWHNKSIESLATGYIVQMKGVQPQGPYFLGGYSGGGVLAYEIAQQLRQQGDQTALLVFIDTFHPAARPLPYGWSERLRRIARHPIPVIRGVWKRTVAKPLLINYLQWRYINCRRRVPVKYRTMLLVREFVAAKWQYRPEPYPGRTLLIRSQEVDPVYNHLDRTLGWEKLIENLVIKEVPGNHFTVVLEPQIRHLAQSVKQTWYADSTGGFNLD